MKKISLILYVFFLLLLICCGKKNEPKCIFKKINTSIDEAREVFYSEIFEAATFIPLQSKENTFLNNIRKIKVDCASVYILNSNNIKVFNRKGDLISEINETGKGPGEYLRLTDFVINNEKNIIEIYDSKQKRILTYDFLGNYLEKWDVKLHGFSFIPYRNNPDTYIFYTGNIGYNTITDYSLNFYSKKKNKIINQYFKISDHLSQYLHFYDENNFTFFMDTIRFIHIPCDTIFSIIDDDILPTYVVDFKNNKMPPDFLNKNFKDIVDFIETLRSNTYASIITGYLENSKYIFFQFECAGELYHVYYNKFTLKTLICNNLVEDILFINTSFTPSFGNRPYACSENEFYYILETYQFVERINNMKSQLGKDKWNRFKTNNPDIINLHKNIKLTDNPILCIYKMK